MRYHNKGIFIAHQLWVSYWSEYKAVKNTGKNICLDRAYILSRGIRVGHIIIKMQN